ncbi:MAG TPA: IS21 family transposase [Acidimicrobiales bacterium]|nr:IS21 family transposase [Acidimicrobiales bacterium]
MLSEEKALEILETYDLTGSYRSTAALCGVDHHTVRRYVAARAAGLDPAVTIGRATITDPFNDKISEWIDRSSGRIRADVVHAKLQAMGYPGSTRTTRRVVARLKVEYVRRTHRVYKPWVTEPGLWLQFDWGNGPRVAGRPTVLFCAWLAWSRYRVVLALPDRTFPSLVVGIDRTLRAIGGAPTYLLTDNEKTVTDHHVAGVPVRNRELLGVAHYYGVAIHTCVVADPESKGGTEATVRIAKADVLPRPDNLVADYREFSELEAACSEATERFNTRVHRVTGVRPAERLEVERPHLHRVPDEPYTVTFGQTRSVSWSSLVSFEGARYSVPHRYCAEVVFVRRDGDEIVITATDETGGREVARHPVAAKGQMVLDDGHYPPRRRHPERTPRATSAREAEFLAIGEGARRYVVEAAASGERHIDERMTEALVLLSSADRGVLDEALGLAALAGRFAAGDLTSILATRREPLRRITEDHSLQPGTAAWSRLGIDR